MPDSQGTPRAGAVAPCTMKRYSWPRVRLFALRDGEWCLVATRLRDGAWMRAGWRLVVAL